MNEFDNEVDGRVTANGLNQELLMATQAFNLFSVNAKYSYNFTSLRRPITQYPQDMVAMQQLIWKVNPDLMIETGIAHLWFAHHERFYAGFVGYLKRVK